MKKNLKILTLLFIISLVSASCNKDDEEVNNRNYLKVGSTEYNLSLGILENYGQDDWHDGYNTDITLFSDGFSITQSNGDYDLTGKGHIIYFEMFSTSGSELDSGVYGFSSSNPLPILSFDGGAYAINYDVSNETADSDESILSGEVTVEKNGDKYNISINCKDVNGVNITGFYSGPLTYFDYY